MITFNIRADNGNYYRGHKPDNEHGNCWASERCYALTLTLEQSRKLVSHESLICKYTDIINDCYEANEDGESEYDEDDVPD